MTTYKIVEQYDGSNWRVLASARTPEAAEAEMERERKIRRSKGYSFFAVRYVTGAPGREPLSNREVAEMTPWTAPGYEDDDLYEDDDES